MTDVKDAIIAEFDRGYRRLFGDEIGADLGRDLRLHAMRSEIHGLRTAIAELRGEIAALKKCG